MRSLFALLSVQAALCAAAAAPRIIAARLLTDGPLEYRKTEFSLEVSASFVNPYATADVAVDMHLEAPSGKEITLPCFFSSGDSTSSVWLARFAPRETGTYLCSFSVGDRTHATASSDTLEFRVIPSGRDGFLHANGAWCLTFDSGRPFRGLGENVGWESRSFEDSAWTYDSLLASLARNGANFFRTWMCQWNLPLEWQTVRGTRRYADTREYYNPGGIRRMDELVALADSLGLFMMLTLDSGGSLRNPFWYDTGAARGAGRDPGEFFRLATIRRKYRDKLRYIVARWGYSTSIAAFEFFNELDNVAFTPSPHDSMLIRPDDIVEWHSAMSRYLHDIDPCNHVITTSISHRDIPGLDALPYVDINQKHIYKHTDELRSELLRYTRTYNRPYVIGEFGYEWDWNIDFSTITSGLEYDYRRGLWYGLFSPTPILPMTWWWEFFESRGMTPYMRGVREISDRMLNAGKGEFAPVEVSAGLIEAYAVRCGATVFVYLLNNSRSPAASEISLGVAGRGRYDVLGFDPSPRTYRRLGSAFAGAHALNLGMMRLKSRQDLVLILTPAGTR